MWDHYVLMVFSDIGILVALIPSASEKLLKATEIEIQQKFQELAVLFINMRVMTGGFSDSNRYSSGGRGGVTCRIKKEAVN